MFSSHLLVLVLHCYLGVSSARTVKRSSRSAPDVRSPLASSTHAFSDAPEDQDPVSLHMLKLYERYSREHRLKDGNTVRGFRAADQAEQREAYGLNLTSLQDSEVILAASLHFQLLRRPRPKPSACKRFRSPACRTPPAQPPPAIHLLLRAASPGSGVGLGSPGSLLANLTFHPHRREVWQVKDLTQVIKEARHKGHDLLSLELDLGPHRRRQPEEALSAGGPPYLLLYADDRALAEPNSVASSLQRYDPLAEEEEEGRGAPTRARREAPAPGNELPVGDYRPHGHSHKEGQLDSTWYLALRAKSQLRAREERRKLERAEQAGSPEREEKSTSERVATAAPKEEDGGRRAVRPSESSAAKRPGHGDRAGAKGAGEETRRNKEAREEKEEKRQRGRSGEAQSPVLSFDERTMRKARRRQWGQSTQAGCSRKNLRVDFADIGWSEWVIAPKAFEAYYCSGTCGFPLAKVTRPSNHATIQSIVRAVGIVPGVPAPCCVPDKMGPLAVLYRDEAGYPVLKVYPNMSVQSCSCR